MVSGDTRVEVIRSMQLDRALLKCKSSVDVAEACQGGIPLSNSSASKN